MINSLLVNSKVSQKFCNILVRASLRRVGLVTKAVQVVEGSIVVAGALTHSDLLAGQKNV